MAFSSEYILTVCAGVAVNGKTILLLRLRCLVLVLGELFNLCFVAGGTAVKWAVIAILFDSVLYWFIGVVLGLFCLDIWLICPKISLDIWTFGGRFGQNINIMTKEQIIAALEQLGKSVSALEKDLGMPSGTLAKAKSGVRELPEKWVTILNDLLATQKEMVVIPENIKEPVSKIVPETTKVETVTIQIAKENQYTPISKEVIVKSADKTFPALLLRFNKLVEDMPKVSLIRAELDKISLDAYGSSELNYNQRSAIMERCSNYIKGDYGRKITA